MVFDDPKESDIPKACMSFQMKVWTMMIQKNLMIISNGSMDFNDPKKFNDILVSPDPKGISIGSMDFDNPKVNGDKFILDGLVYSREIVQITRRGTRKLLKSLYYTTLCYCLLQLMQIAKCLKESMGTFTFFIIFK